MSGSHNPWGMTQQEVLDWALLGMTAKKQESELRRAVKSMASLIQGREWAEHLSTDQDAQELEVQITELIGARQELLDALIRVLDCCDIAECRTIPNSPGALRNARAALAKATWSTS